MNSETQPPADTAAPIAGMPTPSGTLPSAAAQPGVLHVVALPIGHPLDITVRAVEILRSVDVIAAEDTRDLAPLRRTWDISTRAVSYHDFNERQRANDLVRRLQAGQSVALVSDAGTPLVSDPGYRLVRAAIEADIPVTSLPGACAAIVALAASGLPPTPCYLAGFPPRTSSQRRTLFRSLASLPATLIFYEAPHRLVECVADALAELGDRPACLARNLTKRHERYQRTTLRALHAALLDEDEVRGEATLLIGGADPTQRDTPAPDVTAQALAWLEAGQSPSSVQARLRDEFGMRRRDAYQLVLRLSDGRDVTQ